jgi:hypothetical protein
VVLSHNDGWLLTRLPSHPTSYANLALVAAGLRDIYNEWGKRTVALAAYRGGAAAIARGKRPHRWVRRATGDHVVSLFDAQDDVFVLMEIDGDAEITFYWKCRHCQDLTCKSRTEVLDAVVAFGQRHTRMDT